MRISTRIITEFAVLLILSAATAIYQISIIRRMQRINEDLSQLNFEAASIVQKMNQDMFDLEDYSRKYFVLKGDPLYERELADIRNSFTTDLTDLVGKARTPKEHEAIKGLSHAWDDFWLVFGREKSHLETDTDSSVEDFP